MSDGAEPVQPAGLAFRWHGADRRGVARGGWTTCADVSGMAAMVEAKYDAGYRSLRVVAGPGPVPPDADELEVGHIGRHPGARKRIWWAES